jgi:succinoglycan biosynthesis protein ExoA
MLQQCGKPTVSIIIPVLNEERYLSTCLAAASEQDYEHISEILVMDGGSSDRSREIVAEFAARDPRIRLINNPRRIQPAAMNIGLKAASGAIIVRMDAHAYFAPTYVSECVKALMQTDAQVVGGVFRMGGRTFWQQAIAYGLMSPVGVGTMARRSFKPEYVNTVSFGAYRRELALSLGGYDESLPRHEDVEFFARVRRTGAKILRVPEIEFLYYPRESLGALWRQSYVTGRWSLTAIKTNRRAVSFRQLVPGLFVAGIIVLSLAALALVPARWLLLGALVSYLLLILGGSVDIGFRYGWRFALPMPLVFLTLHFGYGLGTFVSIVTLGRPPR